jgi:flagellar biosynthetic protein FliR
MELFNINVQEFYSFFLTFIRIGTVVFMLPFFGAGTIPNSVKGALCFVMSLAVWPKLSFAGSLLPMDTVGLLLMFTGELLLGLVLNIIILLLFSAIQTGGFYMGFAMGFSMMNVLDPMSGVSESVTAQLFYQCAILIFLTINGHLYLLQGLADSFTLVKPGGLLLSPQLTGSLITFSAQIFILAAKISAPIMVSLFLVDLALALVSRAAPQMNVLMVGFPLKIGVGFLFMTMVLTALGHFVTNYVLELGPMFRAAMQQIPGN